MEEKLLGKSWIGGKKYCSMVEMNGNHNQKERKYFMSVQKEKKEEKDELKAKLEALNLS